MAYLTWRTPPGVPCRHSWRHIFPSPNLPSGARSPLAASALLPTLRRTRQRPAAQIWPDSGRRAHGSHERARSARKGRKKHVSVLKWGGHPCLPCVRLQIEAQRRSFKSKPLHRPASQFPSTQQTDTANHQRPVTEPKRNISSVFNKCSRPRLDIRNSAAILRAVNRAHHKRPCRNPCSNECKGKQDLARTPKFKKPDRICQMLQSNFLYH